MKCRLFIALACTVLLALGGWLVYRAVFSNEELASKVEWSVLQAVVSQHADAPGSKIEIVKLDDYSVVGIPVHDARKRVRSEEHTSELQSHSDLVCRLLLEKKKKRCI